MQFVPLTARDIVYDSIPELHRNKRGTISSSFHDKWYDGHLSNWDLFEREAYKLSSQIELLPRKALSVKPEYLEDPEDKPQNHVWNEQFLCGDELSISGRFVQQVLHPVTAVARELKMQRRFGDFKVCSAKPNSGEPKSRSKSGGEVPDFVAVAPVADAPETSGDIPIEYYHELRLVGEAKTPWMHDLTKFYLPHKDKRPAQVLRHALGG